MITSIHRSAASLRCLLADEADFIDAAFNCVLPESRDEGLQVPASAYVDAKLAALPVQGSAEPNIDLWFYRAGIAEVQALCERTQGRRFQALSLWQQLSVLAQIEPPENAPMSLRRCLLELLLNDAAEAYFDAVGSSWAQAHEALRAAAA
jgi:hypothetical protein